MSEPKSDRIAQAAETARAPRAPKQAVGPQRVVWRAALSASLLAMVACSEATTPDECTPDCPDECPATLPEAAVTCTDASCTASTSTKTFAESDLSAADSTRWLVVSWLTSELFDNENLNVAYHKEVRGALTVDRSAQVNQTGRTARGLTAENDAGHRRDRRVDEAASATIYAPKRLARIEGERLIRSWQHRAQLRNLDTLVGTAIRDRSRASETQGAGASGAGSEGGGEGGVTPKPSATVRTRVQPLSMALDAATCSASAPDCGSTALCVIPAGEADGTCATQLSGLKFPTGATTFESFNAVVKRVGTRAAIAVDEADTLSDGDAEALIRRFDEHIGPLDHALFGEPKNAAGQDRDGNGVVLFVVTSRLAAIADGAIVGTFQPNDLGDPSVVATSNGADLLYLQPIGADITLDNVSATIAHEYQHLINFYAKSVNRGVVAGEEIWLDEGLSTLAEELVGYGADAYKNAAAFLNDMGSTSMTGFGLLNDAGTSDSVERRGAVYLFLRYYFEEKGGATFGAGAGDITDAGGIAALRQLVQSEPTGLELFADRRTGRSWHQWVGGAMTAVAIDGADYPKVSCNPSFSFDKPVEVPYTGYPRGLNLRSPVADFDGQIIPFHGPDLSATLETEEVPFPVNAAEIRIVQVPSGSTHIAIGGPSEDYELAFRALPIP
ncbi:MAG: hypothetical protein IPK13_25430 [Deltaproteobacteria bacterium]|nr:hypothetical protein [Deltaproteobacteria bacterium]